MLMIGVQFQRVTMITNIVSSKVFLNYFRCWAKKSAKTNRKNFYVKQRSMIPKIEEWCYGAGHCSDW